MRKAYGPTPAQIRLANILIAELLRPSAPSLPTNPPDPASARISGLPGELVSILDIPPGLGRYPSYGNVRRCMDCGALQHTPHLPTCDREVE